MGYLFRGCFLIWPLIPVTGGWDCEPMRGAFPGCSFVELNASALSFNFTIMNCTQRLSAGSGLRTCRNWTSPPGHFQGRQGRRKKIGPSSCKCAGLRPQSKAAKLQVWPAVGRFTVFSAGSLNSARVRDAPSVIWRLSVKTTGHLKNTQLAAETPGSMKVADLKVKDDSGLRCITKVASSSNCFGSKSSTFGNKFCKSTANVRLPEENICLRLHLQ